MVAEKCLVRVENRFWNCVFKPTFELKGGCCLKRPGPHGRKKKEKKEPTPAAPNQPPHNNERRKQPFLIRVKVLQTLKTHRNDQQVNQQNSVIAAKLRKRSADETHLSVGGSGDRSRTVLKSSNGGG